MAEKKFDKYTLGKIEDLSVMDFNDPDQCPHSLHLAWKEIGSPEFIELLYDSEGGEHSGLNAVDLQYGPKKWKYVGGPGSKEWATCYIFQHPTLGLVVSHMDGDSFLSIFRASETKAETP